MLHVYMLKKLNNYEERGQGRAAKDKIHKRVLQHYIYNTKYEF